MEIVWRYVRRYLLKGLQHVPNSFEAEIGLRLRPEDDDEASDGESAFVGQELEGDSEHELRLTPPHSRCG